MKNSQTIRLLLVILISSTYIIAFASLGVITYDKITNKNNLFPEHTNVAGVELGGKSKEEARTILLDELEKWRAGTNLTIYYKEIAEQFDLKAFNINIEDTLFVLEINDSNSMTATISNDDFDKILEITNDAEVDEEELKRALLAIPAQLKSGNVKLQLDDYLVSELSDEQLASTRIANKDELPNLQGFATEFKSVQIEPFQQISLLDLISENSRTRFNDETLSTVATALYKLLMQTNFTISERHISNSLPSFAELGFEAKVSQHNEMDFSFTNPNNVQYELIFKIRNEELEIQLIGKPFKYNYRSVVKHNEAVVGKTILQYSPMISYGDFDVKREGVNGHIVKISRAAFDKIGALISETQISDDYYEPIHRIEVHSLIEQRSDND